MTRFARAKGSKASNERVPESATPWEVMKDDLKKSQDEIKNKSQQEEVNQMRQKNYDNFIEEEDKKIGKKWAEFPTKKTPMKAKQKLKKKKNFATENDVTDEMIDEFLKSDNEETDAKLEDFKKEIESVLSKNDDDVPEEMGTKVPPTEIVTKKKKNKNKKKKLNIQSNENPPTATKPDKKKVPNIKLEKGQEHGEKRKFAKPRDDLEHKRRKPDATSDAVFAHGKQVTIVRYEGFPVTQTDFERLNQLRASLIKKGVPTSEVKRTMQAERRKCEKYLSRLKKQVCFNCRKSGHLLSECAELNNKSGTIVEQSGTGICFKCGSTEHKLHECKSKDSGGLKFASCFICRERGHLARECPDNPRGLYPNGGACRGCGDVTHLHKDCPTLTKKSDNTVSVGKISDADIDGLGEAATVDMKKPTKKIVKF